ncbi:short-chain dehydrogenase [Methanolobus halotolerans]|uniref:Short-chain dehydrogenase n=1 Tax=Methanolobus halotolerans TaxID=2052935 RepID=A0A4E0PWE9_9EURY|nr:short-chain dehydrogenase [Methanolobus halotolerans]
MKADRRTALITGGAGGIGRELGKLFVLDGYDIVLVDKHLKDLQDVKYGLSTIDPDIRIMFMRQDLTLPDAANNVHEFTQKNGIQVNVLVNCAGFGTCGFFHDIDKDRELDMLQLHVLTVYKMTRLYIKEMIGRNEGKIINMSSVSAFQPSPYFATYGASKSFVLQFSRALNYELKENKLKVRVLAVCPTAVRDTGFRISAKMEGAKAFSSWMSVTARDVALDTYRAMQSGKDIVIPGRGFGLLHSLVCRLPTGWLMRIARWQLKEMSESRFQHIFDVQPEKESKDM